MSISIKSTIDLRRCDGPACRCYCHELAMYPGPKTNDWCDKCDVPPIVIDYSGHPADDN